MSKKPSPTERLGNAMKYLDSFGTPIQFNVNGQDVHKSYFGAFMSLVVFTVTMIYASKRYGIMKDHRDTKHQSTKETHIYSNDNPLTMADAQFNFAYQVYDFSE